MRKDHLEILEKMIDETGVAEILEIIAFLCRETSAKKGK